MLSCMNEKYTYFLFYYIYFMTLLFGIIFRNIFKLVYSRNYEHVTMKKKWLKELAGLMKKKK